MKEKEKKQSPQTKVIPEHLKEQLIATIGSEIKGEFVQRHKLNEVSPSFPYHHRTMANRDSLGTGPKEAFMLGKHVTYSKKALLDMLAADLS